MLPSARHWKTESQAAAEGEYDDSYYFLERMEEKKEAAEAGHDFHSFHKARKKLEELAVIKYGSVANMFREFDDDKSGQISLDEFSKAMKKRNLEPMFSREAQRILFGYLDKDSSDTLELQEFVKFFDEPDPRQGRVDDALTTFADNKKLSPRLQRIKDSLVEKLHNRRRNAKLLDGMEYATQQLLNAFRHIDEDGSGELNVKELHKALGPSYLNLDMSKEEVNYLMTAMDVNHDGSVSYKEFIKFLEVHDIDPSYTPVSLAQVLLVVVLHGSFSFLPFFLFFFLSFFLSFFLPFFLPSFLLLIIPSLIPPSFSFLVLSFFLFHRSISLRSL